MMYVAAVRSILIVCQVTSRPRDLSSGCSKRLETFRTALERYMVGQRDEHVILTLTKIPANLSARNNHIASTEFQRIC